MRVQAELPNVETARCRGTREPGFEPSAGRVPVLVVEDNEIPVVCVAGTCGTRKPEVEHDEGLPELVQVVVEVAGCWSVRGSARGMPGIEPGQELVHAEVVEDRESGCRQKLETKERVDMDGESGVG